MKKVLAIILALAMVFCLAACGDDTEEENEEAKTYKIGLICIGDENDQGYTYNFIRGKEAATEQLTAEGYNIEWLVKYNLVSGAVVEDANRDLAEAGCTIIFNNSYDHSYEIPAVAAEYPEVHFVGMTNENLYKDDLDNTSNAFAEIYKGRYLAGVVAGLKLQSMIDNGEITEDEALIGYVAAYYYSEVISGYTAYYLGAKSVCPSVKMITQMVASWNDPTAEGKAAEALLAQGAVLISQHSDSTTPAEAAYKAGKFHTGYNNSLTDLYPTASLLSTRIDWTKYFVDTIKQAINGEEIPGDYCGTYEDGEIVVTELNEAIAAPGTAEKLAEIEEKLASGEIKVFDTSKFNVYSTEYVDANHVKVTGAAPITQAYALDTDGDWVPDAYEAIVDGEFKESYYQSAPYFGLAVEGIWRLDGFSNETMWTY